MVFSGIGVPLESCERGASFSLCRERRITVETISHDSDKNLCQNCHNNPEWDPITNLCEECYNRLLDAINDTLPNIDPKYNSEITRGERNKEIISLGAEFHLSPETIQLFITSLDQQDNDRC